MVSNNVVEVGIDLGTTHSSVGFWIGEEFIIRIFLSCFAFTDYAEPIIGDEAFDGVDKNPSNTILDVKRLILAGSYALNPARLKWRKLKKKKNDEPNVIVRSFNRLKRFSAEELLSVILKKLKQKAEEGLGLENGDVIVNAVISVPSCYNNAQRLATKRAATMAGFGASHFNDLLYRHCSCRLNNSYKSRLRFACEDAKRNLSNPNVTQTTVVVDTYYVQSPKEFLLKIITLKQDVFDKESKELFDKCQEAIDQCLQDSGIYQFHEVILVGGSTRIARCKKWLCDILEPDKGVVLGAALRAESLSGDALSNPLLNGISIADVAPLSEDEIIENNNLTGYFIFDGIQAAEMGVPNITISFSVDFDGILNVSAAEDESHRQLARQVIHRSVTSDELKKLGRDMKNPEHEVEEESKRRKLESKAKVRLFFTQHMSRQVPDDFDVTFSPGQVEMLRQALTDAIG
ncbi:hypothetical protein MKX01_042501 [Papaver californicum]|nr:hypothetical protein MKX01_042501 [Papaver californicum]